MIFLRLFWEFFKTGLFAVGGGMATIPFLSEMAERTGWFSQAMLADMIAVGESTPGPIGVNTATYVGYTVAGIPGGLVATFGLVLPSFLIILIVAAFLKAFRTNKYVERFFYGIRPASVGMIGAACVAVMRLCLVDTEAFAAGGGLRDLLNWKGLALFAVIWVLTNFVKRTKKLHPVIFIACSAAVGIVFRFAGA
jgi:chromate transporter